MPTLYWCPHQVLKATGAPVTSATIKIKLRLQNGFNPIVLFRAVYILQPPNITQKVILRFEITEMVL